MRSDPFTAPEWRAQLAEPQTDLLRMGGGAVAVELLSVDVGNAAGCAMARPDRAHTRGRSRRPDHGWFAASRSTVTAMARGQGRPDIA
jgi:hypothetical protein